jgi:competence protein ComEA
MNLNWNVSRRRIVLFTAAVIFISISVYFYSKQPDKSREEIELPSYPKQDEDIVVKQTEEVPQQVLIIDIKGEVAKPGVYELKQGSRVIDVIEMAGGILQEGESKALNLARPLRDGEAIYVPNQSEWVNQAPQIVYSNALHSREISININTADANQLSTLSGIGPSKAEAILAYREENGPFKTIEELMKVAGIGPKTFEKFKDKVVVH